MGELHARLGPSNHRWPHCPGSVREEAAYPDIAGEAAIDGTGSHLLLEYCLSQGVRAESYEGQIIGANHVDNPMGWMVSKDRIERVQQCLDYVSRRYAELRAEYPGAKVSIYSETKSNPGEKYGRTDWWGTCDITIIVTNQDGTVMFVEVCDYKDGRGYVDAERNTQLVSYAAGKLPDHALLKEHMGDRVQVGMMPVRMSIVQPKTTPSVRYVDTTSHMISTSADRLAVAAALTDAADAPLNAGEHCKWCKHKPNCTAGSEKAVGLIQPIMLDAQGTGSLFELITETFGDITQMSADKLVQMADARAGIEAVFAKVDAEIQRRVESGVAVDGYAMRPGNGKNEWAKSEEDIVKMLKARRLKLTDIYPSKLISPAQVLKLSVLTEEQKKKISEQYITHKGGELKLTRVRQSVTVDAVALFADVVTPSFL